MTVRTAFWMSKAGVPNVMSGTRASRKTGLKASVRRCGGRKMGGVTTAVLGMVGVSTVAVQMRLASAKTEGTGTSRRKK